MPSRMPRLTSANVENLEMPMRVEIARPSSFMTRRSMVRAMRLVTTRKPTMTTMLLSKCPQAEGRLAGNQVDAVERGFQPDEPAQHLERDCGPDDERDFELPGAEPAVGAERDGNHVHDQAHQQQHRGQVHRDVDELDTHRRLANAARSPRTSTSAMKEGASTMPATTMRCGHCDRSERAASGRSHRLT